MNTLHAAHPLRLIGVGVGPGDPEMVTLQAVRIFRESDVILVPATEASADGPGRAEQVVLAACPEVAEKIQRVPFSMADPRGVTQRRSEAWETSATAALEAYSQGATTVSLATIGDPSVFSTFSYLAGTVRSQQPDVVVELVPGITAMQALAATSQTPLVEGKEVLALVPMTAGVDTVKAVAQVASTVVVYKSGRKAGELRDALADREAIVGTDIGLPQQTLVALSEVGDKLPYFATVLSAPKRHTPGGSL